jgi:hypothetical protein
MSSVYECVCVRGQLFYLSEHVVGYTRRLTVFLSNLASQGMS